MTAPSAPPPVDYEASPHHGRPLTRFLILCAILNTASALAGGYLALLAWAALTNRGVENWAAVGLAVVGMIVVPLQLIIAIVGLSAALRGGPGPKPARRFVLYTTPLGLGIPLLTALVAWIARQFG
jgi:hypothetical protein